MRTSTNWFLILTAILGLIAGGLACSSTDQIPTLGEGEIASVSLFEYELSFKKNGDHIEATPDDKNPSNVYVEVVTTEGAIYTGVAGPGELVVLPAGAQTMTVSDTTAPSTHQLTLFTPTPPASGGGGKAFGLGTQTLGQHTKPYLVRTMSVDFINPDDWDTMGAFTLSAGSMHQAHEIIRAWVQAHGQGALVNSLISEVHGAYTTQFVQNVQGNVVFRITALNDQQSAVSGDFAYEDGTKAPLAWPSMAPVNDLWQTSTDLDLGLFPAGSEGLLESFAVRVQASNRTDGLTDAEFGVEVQGVPVP